MIFVGILVDSHHRFHAAAHGMILLASQVPMLKLLVEDFKADINVRAWGNGLTPLMIAARGGLADSAAWMVKSGGAKLSARTTGSYKEISPGMCAMDIVRLIPNEELRNAMVEALRPKGQLEQHQPQRETSKKKQNKQETSKTPAGNLEKSD